MRLLVLIISIAFFSCGGEEPLPVPEPEPEPMPIPKRDVFQPYCGDAICNHDLGEDEWWCIDCGYDPRLGGPKDGGYCGDGVCFGYETELSCYKDCAPVPWRFPERDPGWIDPVWKGK